LNGKLADAFRTMRANSTHGIYKRQAEIPKPIQNISITNQRQFAIFRRYAPITIKDSTPVMSFEVWAYFTRLHIKTLSGMNS
jgi:hypothetical protein